MSEELKISGWFVSGIDVSDIPTSLGALEERYSRIMLTPAELRCSPKWEPLIRGDVATKIGGWVPLSQLASTRRGIATGANGFFLLSQARARELGLASDILVGCVGRSKDVSGAVFRKQDLDKLQADGVPCLLLDIRREPTEVEQRYIKSGEEAGLLSRYILANRRPWYSMEQREPAAIWATVFGRGNLGFVHNEASARSLTNFHCIYPTITDRSFVQALTVTLNSRLVQTGSRSHSRGYGGGLMKFEPKDLYGIQIPNLREMAPSRIEEIASYLYPLDEALRNGNINGEIHDDIDRIISSKNDEGVQLGSLL